jgi:nucleoid DNA-binding protein
MGILKDKNYKKDLHSIALNNSLSDGDIDEIERIQFEFLVECMKNFKSVRLPSFGVFDLKTRFKNGEITR